MQLFYNPEINTTFNTFIFDKKESGHIIKVLRKKKGDNLLITNGKGFLFKAEIIDDNANKCQVRILESVSHSPSGYQLHMAVAPTKRNERYEWFLEKSTEIGIHKISPIICEHSERRQIKPKRFERVIESAMKQSLQYYKPELLPAISFEEFIQQEFDEQKFIAHCEETEKVFLKNQLQAESDVLILIGPEGDFSPCEIELALAAGFTPVSLGPNRLRTETAAIVACHSVSLSNY